MSARERERGDYRETVAEMRVELITALRSECRGLQIERRRDRKFAGFARNRMRRLLRRIRALDAMTACADAYLDRAWQRAKPAIETAIAEAKARAAAQERGR